MLFKHFLKSYKLAPNIYSYENSQKVPMGLNVGGAIGINELAFTKGSAYLSDVVQHELGHVKLNQLLGNKIGLALYSKNI
jgi:hypothetical protein